MKFCETILFLDDLHLIGNLLLYYILEVRLEVVFFLRHVVLQCLALLSLYAFLPFYLFTFFGARIQA